MFGAEYVSGATALSILVFGFLIGCAVGPTGETLQTYGRTKILMATSYTGAVINILLNFFLIPVYGVNGAAVATGFSFSLVYIIRFLFTYRIVKIQPFELSYLKIILASLIAVFIIYLLTRYVIGVSTFALIVMLFVFLLFYFFLLLLMKSFEEEDLMIMRAIDQRLGTKSDRVREIIRGFL